MLLDGTEIEVEILNQQKVLDYLDKVGYTGTLYPAIKTNKRPEIIGLLVPVSDATNQLEHRFKLEMSNDEFIDLLERNEILMDREQFVKDRDEHNEMDKDSTQFDKLWARYESYLAQMEKAKQKAA